MLIIRIHIFDRRLISIKLIFQHKICHRDLKLENILLDIEGNAKVNMSPELCLDS